MTMDMHGRRSDRTPRDIYDAISQRLEGSAVVGFETLKFRDYAKRVKRGAVSGAKGGLAWDASGLGVVCCFTFSIQKEANLD